MITTPPRNVPPVDDDLKYREAFYQWMQTISRTPPITGTGSPEGVVTANQTELYMNLAGVAGSILYIKRDADIGGNRALGWVLV